MNPAEASELIGRWNLEKIDNTTMIQGLKVETEFDGETISGFSGCNHYCATYRSKNKFLTIESIQNTRKFCGGELYQFEKQYLNALQQSKYYEILNGRLHIFNDENIEILSFEKTQY